MIPGKRRVGRPPGRKCGVLPWQAAYMRRALRVRRALSNKAIARILELPENTVTNYISNIYRIMIRERPSN